MKVTFEKYNDDKKETNHDKTIFLVVVFLFISRLFWIVIPSFFGDFINNKWFNSLSILIALVWAIVPFTLSYTIKDSFKRNILYILSILYLLEGLYNTFISMIL